MGARTGAEYVAGLADGREVWVNGDKVDDVTAYPRFTGSVRGMAADFDDETLRPYLDHYLREAGGVNAAERARLFRAAWTWQARHSAHDWSSTSGSIWARARAAIGLLTERRKQTNGRKCRSSLHRLMTSSTILSQSPPPDKGAHEVFRVTHARRR